MKVIAKTPNNKSLQMQLPFRSFVEGPLSSHLVNEETNPYEVLGSFLPKQQQLEAMEHEELYRTIESACLKAVTQECREEQFDYLTPIKVCLDQDDVAAFKQQFFCDHGMEIVRTDEEPTVA